ncbi:hypothetical protein NP233_g2259 [Leucocoprinus birnbaumii]|uniref:Uncharacterized protein n=1 Tax=Leucocoprinus birnbaumii TaxID=56174 RepID=A0AAD5YZ68_9AGAR|nr:hypothetical protein NP233_g2259 [Leucocoprinus birnbaumii]
MQLEPDCCPPTTACLQTLPEVDEQCHRPTDQPTSNSSLAGSTAHKLHDLLDFSALEDEVAISSRFDVIAQVFMHEYQLVVGHNGDETPFEIQEMEFYLQKAGCHEDPFTHGSEEQKVSGRCSTSLTGYRGGTRKGLDLTIGGPLPRNISPYFNRGANSPIPSNGIDEGSQNALELNGRLRGGILLRSLRSLAQTGKSGDSNAGSVYGPSLLVDRILSLSGASSIPELVETIWAGDTNALIPPGASSSQTTYLYLKHVTPSSSPRIYKSPRIGLDLSHPGTTVPNAQSTLLDLHSRIRFLPKMYRYYTRPQELAKGRPQTLYGFIHNNLKSRPDLSNHSISGDRALRSNVNEGMGLKNALIEKYLGEYDAGKKEGLKHLKLCIGPAGKGAADSPMSYLKMMGALDVVIQLATSSRGTGSSKSAS